MEGDAAAIDILGGDTFQSTPSVWRETLECLIKFSCSFIISIHSLRMEGDMSITLESFNSTYFNPLPPYGGRQVRSHFLDSFRRISIHSLRMEGDSILPGDSQAMNHFNPLPPYGGRRFLGNIRPFRIHFNPLPPYGGRQIALSHPELQQYFNPLPPYGGRLISSARL